MVFAFNGLSEYCGRGTGERRRHVSRPWYSGRRTEFEIPRRNAQKVRERRMPFTKEKCSGRRRVAGSRLYARRTTAVSGPRKKQ